MSVVFLNYETENRCKVLQVLNVCYYRYSAISVDN